MKRLLAQTAMPLLLLLVFFRFYIENNTVFVVLTSFYVFYGCFLCLIFFPLKRKSVYILLVIVLMFFGWVITLAFGENHSLSVFPQWLANIGFVLAALHWSTKSVVYFWMFLVLAAFLGLHLLIGINPENVFTVSRNFISIILILSIAFYYFSCQGQNISPSLLVPALGLILALWAIGRAGIASCAFIFFFSLILSSRKLLMTFFFLFTAIVGSGLIYVQQIDFTIFDIFLVGIERFERMAIGGQRSLINIEYIERVFSDFRWFLFGAPLDTLLTVIEVKGNPHNSFIRLHIHFGLIGVLVIGMVFSYTFLWLMFQKRYLLLLVFFVVLFRSSVDEAAFHGPLDVVLFYCVFVALKVRASDSIPVYAEGAR